MWDINVGGGISVVVVLEPVINRIAIFILFVRADFGI